jgi:hypothetical protein
MNAEAKTISFDSPTREVLEIFPGAQRAVLTPGNVAAEVTRL